MRNNKEELSETMDKLQKKTDKKLTDISMQVRNYNQLHPFYCSFTVKDMNTSCFYLYIIKDTKIIRNRNRS